MNKLRQSIFIKTVAVVMLLFFALSAFAFGVGVVYGMSEELYTLNQNTAEENILQRIGGNYLSHLQNYIYLKEDELTLDFTGSGTDIEAFFDYEITDTKTDKVLLKSGFNYISDYIKTIQAETEIYAQSEYYNSGIVNTSQKQELYIELFIKEFPKGSKPLMIYNIYMFLYNNRFNIIFYALVSLIISIMLFCFLISSFGHVKGADKIKTGFFDKIPFDILTIIIAAVFALLCLAFVVVFDAFIDTYSFIDASAGGFMFGFILEIICAVSLLLITLFWCRCLSIKIKTKSLLKDMIIYKILAKLSYVIKKAVRLLSMLILKIPLIWKTALIIAVISLIEMIALIMYGNGELAIVWFLEKIITVPAVLLIAVNLKKLQHGGNKLASGSFNNKIDTEFMFWEFKKHAENLNSISMGMNKAVDAKMKSERFKTELITNVSHDIKTPLTSIINYVELLKSVNLDNEVAEEYVNVISRQSDRLKKLVEDLVEASKASSGSLSVNLKPCDIGIVISQTVGEYQDRLKSNGLELIVKAPDEKFNIMADGRHLWRVFDNLLNNICKHALEGSRVYLTLDYNENFATITFKNISKYELDISSDELMERFVRGDKSRNTEGSGLGLSIAKSLTEIQGGIFSLKIDGDLFKAILKFKII